MAFQAVTVDSAFHGTIPKMSVICVSLLSVSMAVSNPKADEVRQKEYEMRDYLNFSQNQLTNLRKQNREHWAHYRPTMFAEMEASGTLKDAIENATRQTIEAVMDYAANPPESTLPAQAFWAGWEIFRNEWAFLPVEEGFDEDGEEDLGLNAYRENLALISSIISAPLDVLDDELEEWVPINEMEVNDDD
jgi:hypothetical protein